MSGKYDLPFDLYPVVICQTRYGGTYEGGQWAAFAHADDIPNGAFGDDEECADFWLSEQAALIGVGDSPNAALDDMLRRAGRNDVGQETYREIVSQFEKHVQQRSDENHRTNVSLRDIRLERTNYFDASSGFAFDSE